MLLSLRYNLQMQKYLYKIMIVCMQAVFITWSKLISNEAVICHSKLLQIKYSLVVILGLNSVLGVQYKSMIIDRWWKVSTGIIDVVKSEV